MEEKKSKSAKADAKTSELSGKQKALQTALALIEKEHGKGSVMRMGEKAHVEIGVIPTGSLTLDLALGIGGMPRGRIVEVYGPESSGKTTLSLHVVAQAQKLGGEVAFIDAEHALDPIYARALGVDVDNLLISQPDNGEQALEICEKLVHSSAVDLVVIDSVAALVPKAELEGHMGEAIVGLHARLMSQAMRKLAGVISKTNTVVIFINQLREKVGPSSGYGPNETTTGGRALKFYASVRLEVKRGKNIELGGERIGHEVSAKVVKNKTAPPFRVAEFEMIFGEGISRTGEILSLGERLDLVQKSGTWFSAGETRLGQGKEAARKYLKEHPELAAELEAEIMKNADQLLMVKTKKSKYNKGSTGVRVKVEEAEADFEDDTDDEPADE